MRKSRRRLAEKLTEKLSLPFCSAAICSAQYQLVVTDHRLELHNNPHPPNFKVLPISIDFLEGEKIHRQLASTSTQDPLPKAVGVKPGVRPLVIDTTAGMGMDGMRLAWLGCEVILIERSPIIYELLYDGLHRAGKHPQLGKIIKDNVTLLSGDSLEILPVINSSPSAVLLDPMYPASKKGPRNKKEMRMLRELVGDDHDHQMLFHAAWSVARNRVVVKRPKKSEHIVPSPVPNHHITMKSGRFDVYLTGYL
jgi:16S rRNA (guanine1516-N2)-methyltransferase